MPTPVLRKHTIFFQKKDKLLFFDYTQSDYDKKDRYMPDRNPSEPNTDITNSYEQLFKQIQDLVNSEAGDFKKQVLDCIPFNPTFSKEDMSDISLALVHPGCRKAIIHTLSQPSSDGNSIGHYIKITDRPGKRNQNFQVIRDPNGQLSLAIRIQKVAKNQGARIGTGALNKVSSILRLDSSKSGLEFSICIQRKAHDKTHDPKETEAARLGDLERKLHTDVVYTANSSVVGLPAYTITGTGDVKTPDKEGRLTVIQDNAGDELLQYLKDCEEESPERNFITVFQQLAVQIKAAHATGRPCCDIKPENILIQERDGLPKVVLIDQAGDKARQLKKPDDWPPAVFSDIGQAQKTHTLALQNYNNSPSHENEDSVFQTKQAVQAAIARHYEAITKPLSITLNTPLNVSTVASLNNLGGIAATANTSYPGNGGNLDFLIDNMGENYIHHALLRIDPYFEEQQQAGVEAYLQNLDGEISKKYSTSPETGMPAWAADSFGFLNTMIEVSQAFLKPNQSDDNQKGREMLHQWLVDQLVGIYVTCAYNDDLTNLKDLTKSSDDEGSVYNPLLGENSPQFPSIEDLEKGFYSTLQAIRDQHPLCFSIPQLDAATEATKKLFPAYQNNAPRSLTAPVGDTFVCWRITHRLLDFIHYILPKKQENLLTREQVRDKMSLFKTQIESGQDITLTQEEVKKIETAKNEYKMRFSKSGDILLELAKANAKFTQTLKKEGRSHSFDSGHTPQPKLRKNP